MLTLRKQIKQLEDQCKLNIAYARKNAWRNKYRNEAFFMLEKHELISGEPSASDSFYGIARRGCEQIMRCIADMECNGWEFDYDEIKFDGNAYIDFAVSKPFRLSFHMHMAQSEACHYVEKKKYEMQEVVTRTLVCD